MADLRHKRSQDIFARAEPLMSLFPSTTASSLIGRYVSWYYFLCRYDKLAVDGVSYLEAEREEREGIRVGMQCDHIGTVAHRQARPMSECKTDSPLEQRAGA